MFKSILVPVDGSDTSLVAVDYAIELSRSFDSEISGFTFAREDTFIERRDGLTTKGLRLGQSEMDNRTRLELPERTFNQFVFPDREEDVEERDR